jgi:hypothetical protein
MLQAIEVIVEPGGTIRPLEELRVSTPTRAVLTLLETPPAPPAEQPARGSAEALLQFLRDHPLPPECRRSAEEIDAQIREEREAWD